MKSIGITCLLALPALAAPVIDAPTTQTAPCSENAVWFDGRCRDTAWLDATFPGADLFAGTRAPSRHALRVTFLDGEAHAETWFVLPVPAKGEARWTVREAGLLDCVDCGPVAAPLAEALQSGPVAVRSDRGFPERVALGGYLAARRVTVRVQGDRGTVVDELLELGGVGDPIDFAVRATWSFDPRASTPLCFDGVPCTTMEQSVENGCLEENVDLVLSVGVGLAGAALQQWSTLAILPTIRDRARALRRCLNV